MSSKRVVYLCPSYHPYWVPIFDLLNEGLGQDFVVVTQSHQTELNSRLAQDMGCFPRKVVFGFRVPLADRESERGEGTPFGLNIAPFLPFVLLALRPRVVITNNFGLWSLISLGLGLRTIIFWEGTLHTERTVQTWRTRLRHWMANHASAFVVNGTAAKAYLTNKLHVQDEKVFVGGLCADSPPKTMVRPRLQPAANSCIQFLFVGRLIKGKGLDHLLHAAALLRRSQMASKRFSVTIVGDGPERASLTNLARELAITTCIEFVGAVHPKHIWKYYETSDVFVLPTLHDNWPLVVLEAMSMGLPILLSCYAGSVPDLIRENVNGYSFDPLDHKDLAILMKRYVDHPQLVRTQGALALKISRKYDVKRAVAAYMDAMRVAASLPISEQ